VPAYVALLLIDLRFPLAGSLKAKRKEMQSVKAQLHGRLGAAVAEIEHQDVWQRARLSAVLTSGSMGQVERQADAVERWLIDRYLENVRVQRIFTSDEDIG
jgi:uncharacterized protein YlxP (DUF503 family)